MMAVYHQAHRILTIPIANIQLTVVALIGNTSHQDGVVLSPELMRKHLGKGRRDCHSLAFIVEESIGSLRPLQYDVRTLMRVVGDEALVQFETFRLQDANSHLDACLTNLLNATALHLGKGVYATTDTSFHPLAHDEVGAGRRLAIMRTRLKAHIDCSSCQQMLVLGLDRCKGIDLGMALATAHMIALAQDSAILTYDNGSHHGIGLRILTAILRQLQTAAHEVFVYLLLRRGRFARKRVSQRYIILLHITISSLFFTCFR